jgi:ABC-type phosphate transport system permease subunit
MKVHQLRKEPDMSTEWLRYMVFSLLGIAVAVPTIAGGFYGLYRLVTALQN